MLPHFAWIRNLKFPSGEKEKEDPTGSAEKTGGAASAPLPENYKDKAALPQPSGAGPQNGASHPPQQPPGQDGIAVHIIVVNYYYCYYCSLNMLHKLSFFFSVLLCVAVKLMLCEMRILTFYL